VLGRGRNRSSTDPGLPALVEVCPELPEAIKTGIVAMVKAALK
jgi:hypothetical protein